MRAAALSLSAIGVAGLLAITATLLCQPGHQSCAAPPDAPEETRVIPLESCYATFAGSGCKVIRADPREPYGYDMAQLFREHKCGTSNIVLLRGNDIAAVVKATRWAFTAGR